jgi:hypothetical protein
VDAASRDGEGPPRTLDVSGGQEGVSAGFTLGAGEGDPDRLAALDRLVRLDGGRVAREGRRWSLSLPSLARARAEGR